MEMHLNFKLNLQITPADDRGVWADTSSIIDEI